MPGKVKIYFFACATVVIAACCSRVAPASESFEDLYTLLDTEIDRSDRYDAIKEQRIDELKRNYALAPNRDAATAALNSIINEYSAYHADSSLYYIRLNLQRLADGGKPGEYTRMLIKRADVYAHAGMFSDAIATMQAIPSDSVTTGLKEEYFSTYCALYQYLSEYSDEHETADAYVALRSQYADSLNRVITPGSFNHLTYVMTEMARNGNPNAAIATLEEKIEAYPVGTRQYSILASTLAYIHGLAGNDEAHRRYLVLSAISDVRGAVKENMSFRAVATEMLADGDVRRANRYIMKSIADANFYSAMMRNAQSGKMLPVINQAYTRMQDDMTQRMHSLMWIICAFSFVLLVALAVVYRQFRSIRRVRNTLAAANGQLALLSEELRGANEHLTAANAELKGFNRTKEQYATLFMEYCSAAISSLQHYRQSLRNLALQGGNRASLLKKLESTEMADNLLKDFYGKFDEAILDIYPGFVEKFNALLLPEYRIALRKGELLNTELRVFALLRMGITDSNKIADFLRCSVSTVYTYRSRMRRMAANPADFEQNVKEMD